MTERDKLIKTIKLLENIVKYQDEIDDLFIELGKTTNDNVRNAVKARIIELSDKKYSCKADAIILAYMWTKYLEENTNIGKK